MYAMQAMEAAEAAWDASAMALEWAEDAIALASHAVSVQQAAARGRKCSTDKTKERSGRVLFRREGCDPGRGVVVWWCAKFGVERLENEFPRAELRCQLPQATGSCSVAAPTVAAAARTPAEIMVAVALCLSAKRPRHSRPTIGRRLTWRWSVR